MKNKKSCPKVEIEDITYLIIEKSKTKSLEQTAIDYLKNRFELSAGLNEADVMLFEILYKNKSKI